MADPAPRKSRLWQIILVLSLALNIAVVGVVAGLALRGKDSGPPQRFDLTMGPIGAALTRSQRRDIGQRIRADAGLRDMRRGNDAVIAALVAALREETPDPDALREAVIAPSARAQTIIAAASDALVDEILAMDAAARIALADRLEERQSKRKRSGS